MLNESINTAIEISKSASYTASLVILWISFLLFMPLVTFALKTKNQNWGRFWLIWFLTILITGIVLTFLIISPNSVSSIITKLQGFFA
jgi:ABC-type sulfate transport system permease component